MGEHETAQRRADRPHAPSQGASVAGPRQTQLAALSATLNAAAPVQRLATQAPNRNGLPDGLKCGIEAMSGLSMGHVKVHYNSSKPAQLNAHAYAQGSDIHLGPGQDHHLPHEAWHVVQQAQGRVRPTMQLKSGVPVNDDQGLEQEADVMGARALRAPLAPTDSNGAGVQRKEIASNTTIVQRNGDSDDEDMEEEEQPQRPTGRHTRSQGPSDGQSISYGAPSSHRSSVGFLPHQDAFTPLHQLADVAT